MKLVLVVLAAAVAVAVATNVRVASSTKTRWHELKARRYDFEAYEREYQKSYAHAEEREERRALFNQRLAAVHEHNSNPSRTWHAGINHMSDRTDAELRRLRGVDRTALFTANLAPERVFTATELAARRPFEAEAAAALDLESLPTEVDWREHGVLTPPKDQGQCGSCWSFATAETLESQRARLTGVLEELSEQQVLDCTPNPRQCGGTGGCGGATAEIGYAGIVANGGGLTSEWRYPYLSHGGDNFVCPTNRTPSAPMPARSASVRGWVKLPSNSYAAVMQAVASVGPLAITVDANAGWQHYEEGVFNGCWSNQTVLDHAVQLVGYGVDAANGPYYLVRNSWTAEWGEHGYIRVARSTTPTCGIDHTPADGTGCLGGPSQVKVCGHCGILYDVCYPLLAQ